MRMLLSWTQSSLLERILPAINDWSPMWCLTVQIMAAFQLAICVNIYAAGCLITWYRLPSLLWISFPLIPTGKWIDSRYLFRETNERLLRLRELFHGMGLKRK